jgi:hypothetical protein
VVNMKLVEGFISFFIFPIPLLPSSTFFAFVNSIFLNEIDALMTIEEGILEVNIRPSRDFYFVFRFPPTFFSLLQNTHSSIFLDEIDV